MVVENDVIPTANGNGRSRPASAYKRRKVVTPSGRTEWRVYRPGFRSIVDDLAAGRRARCSVRTWTGPARDPRDLEDLVDAVAATGASARSLSGSLTLTDGGTDAEITMARVMVAMGNKHPGQRAAGGRQTRRPRGSGWYGGGRRPFGYRPDPDAPKYPRTLLLVPAEAAEIRRPLPRCMAGTSLKAIARDWRERGVPSVTGAKWTAGDGARRAGQARRGRAGRPRAASWCPRTWPAILDREVWEAAAPC